MARKKQATKMVELVETEVMTRSISRCIDAKGVSWRRALYHAACMSNCKHEILVRLRAALELP